MTATKPYPGTQAVIRAITLLKAFTDEQPEWQLTALAREVGISKTTAFRLLTALESEGLVTRGPGTSAYRLGHEVVTIGGRALRANDLRSVSHPELEKMAAETHETASLEILSGSDTLILDEVVGKHVMSGAQSVGTRWPAYATSTGKAILSSLPMAKLETTLLCPLAAFTSKTITDPDLLLRDLALTRKRGYAVADEELELGLMAVGAPLFNYDGDVVAAISLAGPTLRLTPERLPEIGCLVRETADLISNRLGYRPK